MIQMLRLKPKAPTPKPDVSLGMSYDDAESLREDCVNIINAMEEIENGLSETFMTFYEQLNKVLPK